ncbi:MAG: hypothetical protein ABSG84_01705 [Acidobacteriaceae bacterium]|jgi:hypothetical protein
MNRLLQLAAALLLTAALAPAQIQPPPARPQPGKPSKAEKPQPENVEWIWEYTPDAANKDGRENDLATDLRFKPFLDQFLTAPQTFWGIPINGKVPSLAETALVHLTVPGKVLADENRYISISGHVVHFAPSRGLLWLDLNGKQHLVVFAALDWIKQGRPTTDPAAEYTLWVFPDEPLTVSSGSGQHPPPALMKSIARWAAEPLPGSGIVQNITHAILVDPDGTQHEVAPSALGVAPPPTPKPNTDTTAPLLKPRN